MSRRKTAFACLMPVCPERSRNTLRAKLARVIGNGVIRPRSGSFYTIRTGQGPFPLEVVVRGELDPQTETAYDLGQLDAQCHAVFQTVALAPTGARDAIQTLWAQLAQPARLGQALVALRLWADRQHHFSLNRSEG